MLPDAPRYVSPKDRAENRARRLRFAYWVAVAGAVLGLLLLCLLAVFVNPINWKNFSEYTPADCIWAPASNAIIVLAAVALAVLMIRELNGITRAPRP